MPPFESVAMASIGAAFGGSGTATRRGPTMRDPPRAASREHRLAAVRGGTDRANADYGDPRRLALPAARGPREAEDPFRRPDEDVLVRRHGDRTDDAEARPRSDTVRNQAVDALSRPRPDVAVPIFEHRADGVARQTGQHSRALDGRAVRRGAAHAPQSLADGRDP